MFTVEIYVKGGSKVKSEKYEDFSHAQLAACDYEDKGYECNIVY